MVEYICTVRRYGTSRRHIEVSKAYFSDLKPDDVVVVLDKATYDKLKDKQKGLYISIVISIVVVQDIKFKATIRKWTNSFIATVPMSFISNDLLQEGKTYEFNVKEVDDNDSE